MRHVHRNIDLNCDMGELAEAIADGTQESLMPSLASVNVACGGHAGDVQTMKTTVEQAIRWKLAVGAHPGYPDRENFGRLALKLPPNEIAASVFDQVRALAGIAGGYGVHPTHVKPHGALFNQAGRDRGLSWGVSGGGARWERGGGVLGLGGSPVLGIFPKTGVPG